MILPVIAITIFGIFAFPGNPEQIAGKGIGYTIAFVSFPLFLSGLFNIVYCFKSGKIYVISGTSR